MSLTAGLIAPMTEGATRGGIAAPVARIPGVGWPPLKKVIPKSFWNLIIDYLKSK